MNSLQIGKFVIPTPIIQGGMGVGISLSNLASAVANVGGVGVIATVAIGLLDESPDSSQISKIKNYKQANIDALRREIRRARELSSGIIGVNIMNVLTDFSEMVKTSIEEKIDIIFSGAGLPLDLPQYLTKNCHTKLVPIVSSGRAAAIICKKWKQNYDYLPDAIVVEGPLAGGHLGYKETEIEQEDKNLSVILQEVLVVTKEIEETYNHTIPVIAGGGISNGEEMYEIMKQGAAGVQIGSKFIPSFECDASDAFKQNFLNAKKEDIRIISSPVGMPGRAIVNDFLNQANAGNRRPEYCKYHCIKSCNPKTTLYCIADALSNAQQGKLDCGFAFAGAYAYKETEIRSVSAIIEQLKAEYQEAENADVKRV